MKTVRVCGVDVPLSEAGTVDLGDIQDALDVVVAYHVYFLAPEGRQLVQTIPSVSLH